MTPLMHALAWTVVFLQGTAGNDPEGSYLHTPGCRGTPVQVEACTPQAGDLVFFDDHKLLWKFLDLLACTGAPDHNGIVIRMPDGSMAILESAPDGDPYVVIQDVLPRLRCYKGTVCVRRLKCPLTEEQSDALTCFALAQVGKRYAKMRLALQITPFRARGPIRSKFLGHTFMDRHRWYCSEIVIAAGCAAGLLDPVEMRANTIYPRDLVDDRVFDLSRHWHEAALWSACAAGEARTQ